jgi:hypothetical protein
VVRHPDGGRVLAVDAATAPRLPAVEVPGRVWYADTPAVVAAFRELLDVAVLRFVDHREDADDHLLEVTMSVALRDGARPPDGVGWIDAAALPDDAATLAAMAQDAPRHPWAGRDWLPTAERWLAGALAETDYRPRGRVEQRKVWELSCVLRQPTDRGDVYLKANIDAPLFGNEARAVETLFALFPGRVPMPVALDPARGWLVTPDLGEVIGWSATVDIREEVVREFARLQLGSAPHIDRLIDAGCLDRRPGWLAAQIPHWFAATNTARWAPPDIAERLDAGIPRLVDLCRELDGLGLPPTLAHGDMHMSNVARTPDGRYIFFDWTDACVAHPFIDLIEVAHERDEGNRVRLRDAYLQEWSGYGDLDRAWAIAEVLSRVNQAVSYMSLGLYLRAGEGPPAPVFASYTREWLESIAKALDEG